MSNFHKVSKAKKKFPLHKRIDVRVKEEPTNPFSSIVFDKIIKNKEHPEYFLYIHDNYITINSKTLDALNPIELFLDKKLWIEIYSVFDVM